MIGNRLGNFTLGSLWRRRREWMTVELLLTVLALVFIAAFYGIASEDRLLLNLYYIGIAAAAYALVKRRALAMMSLVITVAAGTSLAQIYFSSSESGGDPLLDPVRDLATWCILLTLAWRLTVEAYRLTGEERRLQVQREIDEKAIATRAATLTCTSHEVRTPLAAVLSITETLLDESPGPLNELQREFVGDIDRCGKHLMMLVNDILDYAKAQSGEIHLVRERVALPELVEQCVAMVESRAAEGEVTITAQVDPAVNEILADPLRLKQVLLNLLSNAVKYSGPGGMVKIQVRADGDDVVIHVRDTGRGISADKMQRLFDPYYQATHGDEEIGTGLGLAITKHLVELHGGTITVDSVPGSGSLFSVCLPSASCLDADAAPPGEQRQYWTSEVSPGDAPPGAAELVAR